MITKIMNSLNVPLNFVVIINMLLAENIQIIKGIVRGQFISQGRIIKASNSTNEETRNSVKRQKRLIHNSDIIYSSDTTDYSKRCLCPWKTKWHYDSRRTPLFIGKAICSNKCNFNFTDTKLSNLLDVLTSCEPLTRDIRVFKDNKESYLKNWPVACLCTNSLRSTRPKPCKEKVNSKGNRVRRRCPGVKRKKTRNDKRKRRRKDRQLKHRRKKHAQRKKLKKRKRLSRLFPRFHHRIF